MGYFEETRPHQTTDGTAWRARLNNAKEAGRLISMKEARAAVEFLNARVRARSGAAADAPGAYSVGMMPCLQVDPENGVVAFLPDEGMASYVLDAIRVGRGLPSDANPRPSGVIPEGYREWKGLEE